MTKAELIEKIIDAMIDPYNDCPEDYLCCIPIDIYGAADLLDQLRTDEDAMELEPKDRLPEEVTPELIMLAYNCLIRARKHEARVNRLAEFITDNEMVCEYDNYYMPEHYNGIDMFPVDFLTDADGLDSCLDDTSPLNILLLGIKSQHTFNPTHEFCWYDKENNILHSTDHPFGDGILDAKAFAEYIMSDEGHDCFDYITNDIMTDADFESVFGCTREEYRNE